MYADFLNGLTEGDIAVLIAELEFRQKVRRTPAPDTDITKLSEYPF